MWTLRGNFLIGIKPSPKSTLGEAVYLRFTVTQHVRDLYLLDSFINYFGCGRYSKRPGKFIGDFIVTKLEDIDNKIIPFFDKYSLVGYKRQDYCRFAKVAKLMQNKSHLTKEGLEEIKKKSKKVINKRKKI